MVSVSGTVEPFVWVWVGEREKSVQGGPLLTDPFWMGSKSQGH